jgi:hypothetical protein
MSRFRSTRLASTIAAERVRVLWRSPLTILAILLCAALPFVSSAVGAQEFASRQQQHTNLVQELVHNQLDYGNTVVGNDTEPALRAVRQPNPSTILVRGRDPQVPQYVDFSPAGPLETRLGTADGGAGDVGTVGDLESILRVIGGLLAMGLGVQTVTHSKQTGWLRAMQTLPLRTWPLVFGRWLGCCLVIWSGAAICVAVGVSAAVMHVDDVLPEIAYGMMRAIPTWFLYLGTMAAIGCALASWARRPLHAYGGMLLCWLLLAWPGPQFVANVSKLARPVSPRLTMETTRAAEYADAIGAAADQLGDLVSDRHPINQSAAEDLLATMHDELDRLWQQRAREARQSATDRDVVWNQERNRQERLLSLLLMAFPGALASRGASDATDTGAVFADMWRTSIADQQATYNRLLFDDRPRVSFPIRLDRIDRGHQVSYITRREPVKLQNLSLAAPPAVSPRARRSALLRTDLLLLAQLTIALGIAMRVNPDRLRPVS